MKTTTWAVVAVKTKDSTIELGDSPLGGIVFVDGEADSFVSYDGVREVFARDVVEVCDPDIGWMSLEEFLKGDFE